MPLGNDGNSFQSAISALEQARIIRTESHIEIYLDIPSKMFPDVLRAKASRRYDLPVAFVMGHGTEREWWTNGFLYNPFGGPSVSVNTPRMHKTMYHDIEGNEVNDNGPAVQIHEYGAHFVEEWTTRGAKHVVVHREGGPAYTRFEYENPNRQSWLEFTISRDDIDPATDVSPKFLKSNDQVTVFREKEFSWIRNGKPNNDGSYVHREDHGIAEYTRIEKRDLDMFQRFYTARRRLHWRNEDNREHRVDGPATIQLSHIEETQKITDGKVMKGAIKYKTWKSYWLVNGQEISTKRVLDWCRKNRIVTRDGPCFDQSFFVKAEDELCFITDFLNL